MRYSLEQMLDPEIQKSRQDLKETEDMVIMQLYYNAQGDTKKFTKSHNMDFSYSYLVSELKLRGYELKTVFAKGNTIYDETGSQSCANKEQKPYQVSIDVNEKKARKHLAMTESCAQEVTAFLENKKHSYIYVTAAFKLYMKLYEEGKVDSDIRF